MGNEEEIDKSEGAQNKATLTTVETEEGAPETVYDGPPDNVARAVPGDSGEGVQDDLEDADDSA